MRKLKVLGAISLALIGGGTLVSIPLAMTSCNKNDDPDVRGVFVHFHGYHDANPKQDGVWINVGNYDLWDKHNDEEGNYLIYSGACIINGIDPVSMSYVHDMSARDKQFSSVLTALKNCTI